MSESFQILFVTATLICLNKISPGRKIDTINSELFCWKKNKDRLTVQSSFNILFDFQGSSQRLDVTSESESLSQASNIPRTDLTSHQVLSYFYLQVTTTVKGLPLQYQHQILSRESQSTIGQSVLAPSLLLS